MSLNQDCTVLGIYNFDSPSSTLTRFSNNHTRCVTHIFLALQTLKIPIQNIKSFYNIKCTHMQVQVFIHTYNDKKKTLQCVFTGRQKPIELYLPHYEIDFLRVTLCANKQIPYSTVQKLTKIKSEDLLIFVSKLRGHRVTHDLKFLFFLLR